MMDLGQLGAELAALAASLEGMRRYFIARVSASEERIKMCEQTGADNAKRCDELAADCARQRTELREQMGVMVTGVHNRINEVEKSASRLEGEITVMRDRPRTGEL